MDVALNSCGSDVAGGADPGRTRSVIRSGVNAPRYSALSRGLLLGITLFFATTVFAQSAKDPVIYPRGTAPADASAPVGKGETNSSFYLAVALLLGAGGWWLWLKRKGGMRGGFAGATHLTIAETKSLGSRQYLVVADYDGKKYLLGVCPGSIELLTPLEGGEGKDT